MKYSRYLLLTCLVLNEDIYIYIYIDILEDLCNYLCNYVRLFLKIPLLDLDQIFRDGEDSP